ncbi:MAG: ribosome maturation factor RimM [Anaerolineae bacterium]
MTTPNFLLIGEILRPHGVKGEVKMRLLTHHPEHLTQIHKVCLSTSPDLLQVQIYELDAIRLNEGFALVKLAGLNDRNQVELLRQMYVGIAIEDAVPLEEGEHFQFELIGIEVQTEAGEHLGTLQEILETGANDVYILNGSHYGEVLIPVTDDTILSTDVAGKTMVVRLPEGLLPSS